MIIRLQVLNRFWIHGYLHVAVVLSVCNGRAGLEVLAYLLNAASRCEIVRELRYFMGHDFRFGGIGTSTLLGVLRFAYRLSLRARIVERFRLWRKLIILTILTTSIGCHERALSDLLLCFCGQRFVHLSAVIVPVRSLEFAGLVDVELERTIKDQRLVFF